MAPRAGGIRCGERRIVPGGRGDGARAVGPIRRATAILDADPARALQLALELRADGGVPVIGDDRWSPELAAHFTRELATADLPRDAAWGTFTSGSTGRPRTVLRSAASWHSSHAAVSSLVDLRPQDVVYAPAPLVSSLSLFAAVHALSSGADIRLPVGHSLSVADLRDSTVLHATPFALGLAIDAIESGHPHALRVALIGGDRVPALLRSRAEALGVRVISYYGAAELSFVAVDKGDGLREFPGVELHVRDGTIRVRSPYLAIGYLPGQAGPFEIDPDRWATVGDRATLAADGTLTLDGRADGAILTAGATVVPGDVEEVIRRAPGVREVVALGIEHPRAGAIVAAVIECDEVPAAGAAQPLRAFAAAGLSLAQRPRRWYWSPSLPRTASGKLDRGAIADAVARGDMRRL